MRLVGHFLSTTEKLSGVLHVSHFSYKKFNPSAVARPKPIPANLASSNSSHFQVWYPAFLPLLLEVPSPELPPYVITTPVLGSLRRFRDDDDLLYFDVDLESLKVDDVDVEARCVDEM
jgi:hypothetical protein